MISKWNAKMCSKDLFYIFWRSFLHEMLFLKKQVRAAEEMQERQDNNGGDILVVSP